jgi:hypothetical protein
MMLDECCNVTDDEQLALESLFSAPQLLNI